MKIKKRIVLDANVMIRAVLGVKVRLLLEKYFADVEFFTPEVCYQDAKKYLPPLFEKRNLQAGDALAVLEVLTRFINVVDSSVYSGHEMESKQRIAVRDIDDWPVVAVSLLLNCPVWTEDADFFGTGVATWTSDRVHLYLSS